MLFALGLLGRRRQPVTTLLVIAVVIPGAVMFGLGVVKRDLFDIRYLSTTIPLLFVLIARSVTGVIRSRRLLVATTGLLVASMIAGLGDQQLNGSNPRLYDFRGALHGVNAQARPGDVLVFDPLDLRGVIQYYSPHLRLAAVGPAPPVTAGSHTVFVLASRPLMNGSSDNAVLGGVLHQLRARDRLVSQRHLSNVDLWEFR
jgi:hypothetical protein